MEPNLVREAGAGGGGERGCGDRERDAAAGMQMQGRRGGQGWRRRPRARTMVGSGGVTLSVECWLGALWCGRCLPLHLQLGWDDTM